MLNLLFHSFTKSEATASGSGYYKKVKRANKTKSIVRPKLSNKHLWRVTDGMTLADSILTRAFQVRIS
jgi:hypothetical protein